MLETRNLDFKRVILLSANEGTLPSGRSQGTLIPYELQRAFNLPTYEEKDSVYAYNFYRLLQRAEKVYLVYSSEAESMGKGEESRFIPAMDNQNLTLGTMIDRLESRGQWKIDLDVTDLFSEQWVQAIEMRSNYLKDSRNILLQDL